MALAQFTDVDITKFKLNGVEYLKNFIAIYFNDSVRVVGAYDSDIELIRSLDFSEFTIEGASFSSAALLSEQLSSLIFSKNVTSVSLPTYQTKALLDSQFSNPQENDTAFVINDPNPANNGQWGYTGGQWVKGAQTLAQANEVRITQNESDIIQNASDISANASEIASNDSDILQNANDISANASDIIQNASDIVDNQTRSTDTENILLVGSDAYTHAERGVSDGFTTERLVQLDNEIEANLDADFYFKAGHSKGAGKIGIAVPDVSNADLSLSRNANATFVNKRRLIETALPNVARFDWSSGEPALLTEPQAENLFEYSDNISQWGNNAGGGTEVVTSNYLISPDGTQNADRVQTSGTNAGKSYQIIDATNNEWSYSGYIKNISLTSQYRLQGNSSNAGSVDIDVSTLQVVSSGGWSDYTTLKQMPNGWVYFKIEGIPRTGAGNPRFFATLQTNQGNQDLSVWGLQVEVGDKATSYIPTNGATAVRLADTGIQTGDISQYIDSTQGSFEVEWKRVLKSNNSFTYLRLQGDTTNDRVETYFKSNNKIETRISVDGTQYLIITNANGDVFNTVRIEWGNGEMRSYINNVLISTLIINNFSAGDLKKIVLDNGADRDSEIKYIKIS